MMGQTTSADSQRATGYRSAMPTNLPQQRRWATRVVGRVSGPVLQT